MSHSPCPPAASPAHHRHACNRPDRFSPELASGRAAWLWCPERNRLIWATAAGLALWGSRTLAELRHSQLCETMPAVALLRRTLCGDPPHGTAAACAAHTLTFWGPRGPLQITANLARVITDTDAPAVLILAEDAAPARVEPAIVSPAEPVPAKPALDTCEAPMAVARGAIDAEPAVAEIMAELGRLVAAEITTPVVPQVTAEPPAMTASEAITDAIAEATSECARAPLALAPPAALEAVRDGAISEAAVLAVLEAFPRGIALARGSQLIGANRAFALAFGHKNTQSLISRGGLKKVLPLWDQQIGRLPALGENVRDDRKLSFIAQTASGRKLTMPAMVSRIAGPSEPLVMLSLRVPEVASEPEAAPAPPPVEARPAQEPPSLGLFAKISHDVRTPLNSIIGFAEMMQRASFGPVTNPRYRGYIDDIHVSATHALSLINDLLDLAKLEAGRFACEAAPVGINAVVAECVASLEPQARAEDIVLRAALSPDLPPIAADARRMKQVLLNILSNAVKFTDAGGQVIIATSFEPAGQNRADDRPGAVVVRVRDSGRGMTPAELVEALEVFGQPSARSGHGLRAASQAGSGLGLPLAKALTEAQGGTLAIESAPGAGTRVTIRFPATAMAGRTAADDDRQSAPPAKPDARPRPQRPARSIRAAE